MARGPVGGERVGVGYAPLGGESDVYSGRLTARETMRVDQLQQLLRRRTRRKACEVGEWGGVGNDVVGGVRFVAKWSKPLLAILSSQGNS